MSKIKYLLVFFIFFISNLFIFAIEKKASYLSNEYFAPKVSEMEEKLLTCKNIKLANVYKAENPFYFTPDLFRIEVETFSGHQYFFHAIPMNLEFYNTLSSIMSIDGVSYVTIFNNIIYSSSSQGVVLSKLGKVSGIKIKTLIDLFANEEEIYDFLTNPNKEIYRNKKRIWFKIIKFHWPN